MAIPYEKQFVSGVDRTCGAAALQMVYSSYSLPSSQTEIWNNVSLDDGKGKRYTQTYRLCAYSLQRGFSAVILRALDPIELLRKCKLLSIRAILNHRLRTDSQLGHYTVLVDVSNSTVTIHDPENGPSLVVPVTALTTLWQKTMNPACEISGNILLALSMADTKNYLCSKCEASVPDSVTCLSCRKSFPLQPTQVLGCIRNECEERTWSEIICPFCDHAVGTI
jgi:hypothetical protein